MQRRLFSLSQLPAALHCHALPDGGWLGVLQRVGEEIPIDASLSLMVVARQHFLVTLGDDGSGGATSVVLSTCCTTPSGALTVRDALAAEGNLAAVSTTPARSGAESLWWESAELLTLALLVLPACCHSAATTILTDELTVGAAAKVISVCIGSAVSIKYALWFFGGRRSGGLTSLQLRVGLAVFGVATATMAAFVAWVLAMETTLLTVVLCVVIFAWAITSACMVAPLILSSAEHHQARQCEMLKQLRSTAATLARVPLLRHRGFRELENSACAHSSEACFCVGCHVTCVSCVILRLLSRGGSGDRGIRAWRYNH